MFVSLKKKLWQDKERFKQIYSSRTMFFVCQGRPSCALHNTLLSYLMSRFVMIRNGPQLESIKHTYTCMMVCVCVKVLPSCRTEAKKNGDLSIMLNQGACWRWAKIIPSSLTLLIPLILSFSYLSISSSGHLCLSCRWLEPTHRETGRQKEDAAKQRSCSNMTAASCFIDRSRNYLHRFKEKKAKRQKCTETSA